MTMQNLQRELHPGGIQFQYSPEGEGEEALFPLGEEGGQEAPPALQTLETLWYEESLQETDEGYFLPLEEIYELEPALRGDLGLPGGETEVDVELRTESFPGSPDFAIRPVVRTESDGLVLSEDRTGAFLDTGGEVRLVSRPAGRLLSLLARDQSEEIKDQLLLIGEVKELAQDAGARLDDFLSGQEIVVPEGIAVEAEAVAPDEVRLKPVPVGADFDLGSGETKNSYFEAGEEGRQRFVLTDDQVETADQVKRQENIEGSDVGRFLSNPEAFVPDEVDLSEFSLRVTGLVPKHYNSQPYLELEKDRERDWFGADIQVETEEEDLPFAGDGQPGEGDEGSGPAAGADADAPPSPEEPAAPPDFSPEEFADLCETVVEQDDPFVLHDGDWVEVDPERAEAYLDAWDNLERDEAGGYGMPEENTRYVLDVISNVDELEFVEGEDEEPDLLAEIPEYPTPELFAEDMELRPYQKTGYSWLRYLYEQEYGGLLADDMGLGKTVQVIALMAHLAREDELAPSLLVVPAAVMDNWHEEIRKFCPAIQHIYHHRGSGRTKDPARLEMCEVVLTTYATLRRDQIELGQVDWTLVGCDEAQKVKNPTAERTSAVKAMKADLRLALTGTPVENGLSELWCIVDFAQPGRLGSRKEFKEEFERPIQEGAETKAKREELATRLQERLIPHYIRRVKEDVLGDLPERTERRKKVPLSPSQKRQYKRVRNAVHEGDQVALGALQNLKQICSHPDLYSGEMRSPEKLVTRCPKLQVALDYLDDVQDRGEKALVYTEYRHMQRILQECIQDRFGVHAPILNGEVRTGRRHERVERFNADPGFGAMILSPEAAGVGLNIVGANHVIHYTRLWNPAKEKQATDRVYRIGQERPVTVFYPIVKGDGFRSMEQHLDDLLVEKRKLAKDVVWPRDDLSVSSDMQSWLEETGDG